MAKLIYIISTGHSGSTLLDILIGSFANTFSTGEFKYFTWQLFRTMDGAGESNKNCTCDNRFQECEIWKEVIKSVNAEHNIDITKAPLSFNTSILSSFRYRGKASILNRIVSKFISFEMYFMRSHIFSNLFKRLYIKNVENVWELIDNLGNITKNEYIIDSSKELLRFYLLRMHRPNDVHLIINTRDSFGYANSYVKHNIDPSFSLRVKKKLLNRASLMVKNHRLNYYNTQYESFSKDPRGFLIKCAQWIDLSFDTKQLDSIDTKNYHLVAGNPMRYQGKIIVKYDEGWKKQLNPDLIKRILIYKKKFHLED